MSAFYEAETPASAVSSNNPLSALTPGGSTRISPMNGRASAGFGGAYNPQQWGPIRGISGDSVQSPVTGQIRSTLLAPRLVGPDGMINSSFS